MFLGGREIKSAWYADPRRGVIKTNDVYDSGDVAVPTEGAKFIDSSWDAPVGGILSKTLRGSVKCVRIGPYQYKENRRSTRIGARTMRRRRLSTIRYLARARILW